MVCRERNADLQSSQVCERFSKARRLQVRMLAALFLAGLVWDVVPVSATEPVSAKAKAPDTTKAKKTKKPSFPGAKKVSLEPQTVRTNNGKLKLKVNLDLPKNTKLNPLAPMGYLLETVSKEGPVDRSAPSKYQTIQPPKKSFDLLVPITGEGSERLRLSMNYYHCEGDPATGVCRTGAVIWDIPIEVVAESAKIARSKDAVEIRYEVPNL